MSRARLSRAALRREVRKLALDLAQALIEVLEQQGSWGEGSGPLPTARAAAPSSGREGEGEGEESRRVRRSAELLGVLGERIRVVLRHERAPVAISVLARRLGTSPRAVAHPLAQLVARGEVSKSGTRRGTRYAYAPWTATGRGKRGHRGPAAPRTARRTARKPPHKR